MNALRRTPCHAALHAAAALACSFILAGSAAAQAWPTKPVRAIFPSPGGGGLEVLIRVLASQLSPMWGQPIVVESRPGANTLIGTEFVAKSAPDGYTLLITSDQTFTINPHMYAKLPYDPVRDFQPITRLVSLSQLMVVNPSLPANNLQELIALAKAKPGALSYASYGAGSHGHLGTEMLKSKAGIDILHVPYKGLAQAQMAVIAGEIPITWSGIASSLGSVRAGKLRAIAISGARRAAQLPDLPTFAELGFPDVDANAWFGVFAPAGTPRTIVDKIHADLVKVMAEPAFRDKEVLAKGYDYSGFGPDEFGAFIRAEITRRREVVRISGAKAE